LVATDTVTGETIGELWESGGAGLFAGQFSPLAGDSRMLADSDDSGARRAFIWDPRSGERTALSIDEIDGEVVGEAWSPDGEKILLRQAWRAQQQLWLYDIESSKARRLEHDPGVITLPGMWVPHFTEDGNIETVWENSANTPRSVLLDGTTGRKIKDLLPVPELPPARAWRSFECDTPDGDRIQCWLATPEGTGPFPTVLETHGGPTAVTLDMFHPASQAYLDHGFAFCSVNYRGSTGFGRDYERKIWGCLGKWEVEDMVAARQWLVDEGIAHADNIFLTGGSYGGYLTLQALGTKPDLWAGGVALVAIADWTALYDEAGDMLRGYQRGLFEGTPDEKPEQYAESSPVTHVEDLKAPVLIIQGRNDARCPAGQMEAYVAKARSLGKPVEIEWFDAGHGAFDTTITVAWMEKRLQFFYDHLHQT
jgi:dipeptidyl aminopeptidase/acylaminoacyl peptidase